MIRRVWFDQKSAKTVRQNNRVWQAGCYASLVVASALSVAAVALMLQSVSVTSRSVHSLVHEVFDVAIPQLPADQVAHMAQVFDANSQLMNDILMPQGLVAASTRALWLN